MKPSRRKKPTKTKQPQHVALSTPPKLTIPSQGVGAIFSGPPNLPTASTTTVQLGVQRYSGPIPPAAELEHYEHIHPGLADRIVQMAEREQAHRHSFDAETMRRDFNEGRLGQIFALVIGVTAILVGGVCALNGANLTGSIIGGGGVIGLVSVFVYGRRHAQSSLAETPEKPQAAAKKK